MSKCHTVGLKFKDNSIKILALSRKTLDSNVNIFTFQSQKRIELSNLNKNNLYFQIPDNFNDFLLLSVKIDENDAFIKFLSIPEEKDDHIYIMAKTSFNKYKIGFRTSTLFIPYTQKQIEIQLYSNESFKYSFSGGLSSNTPNSWYYYNSSSNGQIESPKIDKNKYSITIKFPNIYKNIFLIDREYFTFTIGVNYDKTKFIYLNYKQYSDIDELLDEEVTEIYCNKVIKNLQDLFEIYVYSDIAKNPPNNMHDKIDINERLSKISTTNRFFYEFYQDIETIIGVIKDRHLSIVSAKTPKDVPMAQYKAHLPFKFIIGLSNGKYRIFIRENKNFINKFDNSVKTFIDKHINIPVKNINNIDPFDYIQNWSKFKQTKNMHAQFTKRIDEISNFGLNIHPLNYTDLSLNEFEFDDDQIIRVGYYIEKPKIQGDLKFDNYILNLMKNEEDTNDILSLDKIYNDYLIFSGKKKQSQINSKISNLNSINWNSDLSYNEGDKKIKCNVDQDKKVNVIYQNSFGFKKDLSGVIGKMLKCAKLFFSNDYPIIIIESNNGGGAVRLYTTLLQFLQPIIEFKDYRSYKITPISEEYLKKRDVKGYIDTFDCKEINTFQDIKEFYEDSYGDNSILHKRTSPHDPLEKSYRLALLEYRKEILNQKNVHIKRPTDIIIFTDSYSYSATSGLIKGFQNTGSAVTVGYFGNPKRKGVDSFDASQSSSTVDKKFNNKIKSELKKLGIAVNSVTISESYNFHQKNVKDQIPREYEFDPVDFRVNIYSHYSDNLYDIFIDEGLRIHNSLNKDNQCNPKNDKLLLYDDKCKIITGDPHAHGGFKCNKDTGMWDTSKCKPYYCDIGYYFAQIQKKCVQNCNYPNEKSFFIYEDNNVQKFNIEKNIKYNFIFLFFKSRKYFYEFKSNNIIKWPITSSVKTIQSSNIDRTIEIHEVQTKLRFININKKKDKI